MLGLKRRVRVETERMTLRLPEHGDWRAWAALREVSAAHLMPWEPVWAHDHLTRRAFTNRVYWAQRAEAQGTALPFLLIRRQDQAVLGAITLDNIRRGPSQSGTLGYWIGRNFAGRGYGTAAVQAMVGWAFSELNLHRVEAACVPDNTASRRVLEKSGFQLEGQARAYLKINGAWADHLLFGVVNDGVGRGG